MIFPRGSIGRGIGEKVTAVLTATNNRRPHGYCKNASRKDTGSLNRLMVRVREVGGSNPLSPTFRPFGGAFCFHPPPWYDLLGSVQPLMWRESASTGPNGWGVLLSVSQAITPFQVVP